MKRSEPFLKLAMGAVLAGLFAVPAFSQSTPQLPATLTMLPTPASIPDAATTVHPTLPPTTPSVAATAQPLPAPTVASPAGPAATQVSSGTQTVSTQQQPALVIPGLNPGAMSVQAPAMSGQGNVESTPLPPVPNDQAAYDSAAENQLPMTPAEIMQFRELQSEIQQAEIVPVGPAPTPLARSLILSLKPGLAPPILNLYPGNATTLTFADQTGAPWPVTSVTVGNPKAYAATEIGDKNNTNMVSISPLTNYAEDNNLTVTLKDCPVPLSFHLQTGTHTVDYRVDLSVQGTGPNATPPVEQYSTIAPTDDSTVQSFVDGTPPQDAVLLKSSDPQVQAWEYQNLYYVRTALTMLSPAYTESALNLTVNVYALPPAPVLVLSDDGRPVSVDLSLAD